MIINYGITQITINPSDDSYRYRSIMGEHGLTLMFSLAEFVDIPVGAYCAFEGNTYTLEKPLNVVKKHSRSFDYTLIMESSQAKLNKYKLRNIVDNRLKFNLTATPDVHLQQIIDNLNQRDSGWTMGTCLVASDKLISYNHTFLLDALNQIAEEFNTEWEINQKIISLRKVEYNKSTPLALSYGRGNGFRSGVSRINDGNRKAIEVLFVQGGEKNIDASLYGDSVLLLPKEQTLTYEGREYIVDADGYSIKRNDIAQVTGEEDSLDLSNIYPKREGTISSVIVVDEANNFYDFIDSSIPLALDYSACLMDGMTMTVIFQSGILSGREFEVSYNHTDRKFAIVPQEMDGMTMPNATFIPAINDRYIVFNMGMPEAYIRDDLSETGASWDMFREAIEYFYEHENPGFSFTGELDGIWSKQDWLNVGGKIILGGHIQFTDSHFQTEPILIRITGIKDYINNPYSPIIDLSNNTGSASLSSELKQLDAKEVVTDQQFKDSLQFTRRTFRSAQETMMLLQEALLDFTGGINPITVQTMQLLVGDESLQFRFVDDKITPVEVTHVLSFNTSTKIFTSEAGIIQHMTFGIDIIKPTREATDYHYWDVAEYNSPPLADPLIPYYFYIRASKTTEEATFYMSETAVEMDPVGDYYYFLMGFLNSEFDNDRQFAIMYGFTEVLPGRITTNVVATDTLLAEFAKLADWIIENGKIRSVGETGGIPWAELDGANGLLTFIKGVITAQFGIIDDLPKIKLANDDNLMETFSTVDVEDENQIGLQFSNGAGDTMKVIIDNRSFGDFIEMRTAGDQVVGIGLDGIEIVCGSKLIGKLNSQKCALYVVPSIAATYLGAAIYASSISISAPNVYAAYFRGNMMVDGFSQLGLDSPKIKVKKFTGTTSAIEGGTVGIAHGLDYTKIIMFDAIVNNRVRPNYGQTGYRYEVDLNSINFSVYNNPTSSENILSKPFVITVIYEE